MPSATVRASRSAGPPAAYGLINVTVRSGKDWAKACSKGAAIAKRTATTKRITHPSQTNRGVCGPKRASGDVLGPGPSRVRPQYHTVPGHLAGSLVRMAKITANKLLPTTLVGSYPQPDWLIDRRRLAEIVPPRAHARELWRVDPSHLEQAQDDATI